MVGLRQGKTLRKKPPSRKSEAREEPLLAIPSLALAADVSNAEDLPLSTGELGMDLDDIKLGFDEKAEEGPATVPEGDEVEPAAIPGEGVGEIPDEDMLGPGLLREIEEVAPGLPFLFTEREGRDIVLFARSKFLPTVRIRLKDQGPAPPSADPGSGERPSSCREDAIPEGPISIVDFTKEQDIESLMGELGLPSRLHSHLDMEPEEATTAYGIPPKSVVLLEGRDPHSLTDLADSLTKALLDVGGSLTYITTRRDLKEVMANLFETPSDVSQAVRDLRLLIIPVYPLLHGKQADRPMLLEKLTGAPRLFDKDIVLINAMTDFLDRGIDDMEALRIWPFLRKLAASDKVVLLCADGDHRATACMRSACAVHLCVSSSGKGPVAVEVVKAPEWKSDRMHLVKFQVNAQGSMSFL